MLAWMNWRANYGHYSFLEINKVLLDIDMDTSDEKKLVL